MLSVSTTAHSARKGQGPGRRNARCTSRPRSGRLFLLPSRSGGWPASECAAGWARQLIHAERSSSGSCRSRRALELSRHRGRLRFLVLRVQGRVVGRGTPGGLLTTMIGAGWTSPYGGPRGSSCRGGGVSVIMQLKFH